MSRWYYTPFQREMIEQLNQIRKELVNQTELAQELNNLTTQLLRALNEIISALQAGQEVTPEVIEKLNAAKALAQQLDDLNPDNP